MWLCGIWRAFEERVILFLKNEKREKEKEYIYIYISYYQDRLRSFDHYGRFFKDLFGVNLYVLFVEA